MATQTQVLAQQILGLCQAQDLLGEVERNLGDYGLERAEGYAFSIGLDLDGLVKMLKSELECVS